jgi:voltage-gated potassium channel
MKKLNYPKLTIIGLFGLGLYVSLVFILLHYEQGHESSNIQNLNDAFWYSIVTFTTVGYGDFYPVTHYGRIIGFVFLMFSFAIYAILIGQITSIMNTYRENKKMGLDGTRFSNHVVIIGWTDFGKAVADQLVAAKRKVAIVTNIKDNIDLVREYYTEKEAFVLFSDYNNIDSLEKLNISEASVVFVNLLDDTDKLVYVLNLKKQYEDAKFVVTLDNADLKSTFQTAGVTYAVSKHEISSKLLASYIFEPDVAAFSEEIISYAKTDDHFDIKQFKVLESNPYKDQYYGKIFYDLKKECNCILIGIVKDQDGKRNLMKNPEDSVKVEENDYLIMIMNRKAVKKLTKMFNTEEGFINM